MTARQVALQLKSRMSRSIIGQEAVVERLLLTLLCNGNLLLEGPPASQSGVLWRKKGVSSRWT